jgi:hypothetical protein
VFAQGAVAMGSDMLQQSAPKLRQRLYDLIREVVEVHVAFPDPSLLPTAAGLSCNPLTLPGRDHSPVVPRPYNLRSHPLQPVLLKSRRKLTMLSQRTVRRLVQSQFRHP